jgi:SAM-dependent methyltransferase
VRVGAIPENVLEAVALAAGMAPTPVLDSLPTAGLSRALIVATKVGIFEALEDGPLDVAGIVAECHTHVRATEKLVHALSSHGYLRALERGRFELAPVARKWCLASSEPSLRDHLLLMELVWKWMERYETFVRTGETMDIHRALAPDEWDLYQRGMRSLAGLLAAEVALRLHVPRHATRMLDVGGSHGYYSVALCRKHPGLSSVVIDLPEAIASAAPILAREGMAGRVTHRAADARTADLGTAEVDLVLVAQLVHHFTAEENRDLMRRIARALRPGGHCVILEIVRPEHPGDGGAMGALGDLYFAALSNSGTWSYAEMAEWQSAAGLLAANPTKLLTAPGVGLQVGKKSGS